MLIGLHGKMQSGKDTCGQFLIERLGFKRLAFADALKQALYSLNPYVALSGHGIPPNHMNTPYMIRLQEIVDDIGWERAKTEVPETRTLLQRLGTEAGRDIHGYDCWTNIVKRQIEQEPAQNFVITDLRFPNEKAFVEQMGGYVVHIIRDGQRSDDTHASEQVLEGIPYKIMNNGSLGDLQTGIYTMYRYLTIERETEAPMTVNCYIPCIQKEVEPLDTAASV